ncbi:Rrf2 family transcriptional regulator [Gordonia alkaliphila]|uniref:RrF2 family transcriptional regulator n=1 Tax=Gordonia alkaliphila TaxID=1053547 RepID=UPI001FF6B52A|nr:Rrf2 family transcriptional regulator [Gordonia alkaliphila]MCK0440494.1 Rrf2 family transcriptional regulator [Gordonia alkaliphila]
MQLTRFTDIGLRVLMRLAADETDVLHTSRGLASELGVPYAHVAKVVSRLAEIGVVHARRGRAGGLMITELGRTAGVGWVTRQLEGDTDVVDCDGPTPCPLRAGCTLRGALARAQRAFYESLDSLTVADLIVAGPTRVRFLSDPALPLSSRADDARAPAARDDRLRPSTAENRNPR